MDTGAPDARDPITLAGVVNAMIKYRWAIAVIILVSLLLGARAAFLTRPMYKADMLIQLDDGSSASSARGWLGEAAALFDGKSSASAEAQIIASRLVVSRAVDSMQGYIDVSPRRPPVIGSLAERLGATNGWPRMLGLSGYAWGRASVDVASFDVPVDLEAKPFTLTAISPRTWQLAGPGLDAPVRGDVGVERIMQSASGEIRLKVLALDASAGTPFTLYHRSRLKVVGDVRKALTVQEKVKQSGIIIATLTGHDPVRVSALLGEIGDQYIRQNVERKSAEAAQSLAFMDLQLPELKRQLELVQGRYTAMTAEHGIVDLPEEARLALRAAADAETKLMALRHKRDELATRFTSEHPGMVALERQISAVRQQQQNFDQSVRRLPALQQQAAELRLDMQVATDLYTVLLGSTQQLQLMKAGRVASARIVDIAVTAEEPVRRNRLVVMLVSLFGGLATSIGFVIVMGWLTGTVSEPDEIERALGVGVLGTVPLSKTQRKLDASGQVRPMALVAPADPTIESVRSLRTALVLSNPNPEKNVLLLSAAEPGAGKSFMAANLAAVLAAGGQRVLLVDADIRRGYLHDRFGVLQAPGLSDVLAGAAPLDGIVHAEVAPGVDLIARGSASLDTEELFTGAGLGPVLDAYRSRYDWVIVDTPPILAVADATMLARHADVLMLVARSGQSRLGDLKESCKRLKLCGLTPNGIILNGVVPRLGCYGTTYGMAYGSYYDNNGR